MSDPEEVMKRCRAGTTNHEAANALHADCYGTIGSLEAQVKKLEKDRDFWAETAQGYKDHYNAVIRTISVLTATTSPTSRS